MSRRVAALLGAAALVGSLAGGAVAGWRDALTLEADITLGYVHYAVGEPAASPDALLDEAAFTGSDGSPGWTLPAEVLADVTPATPQTAVVQVDGYAQGNRGLSYRLPAVDVAGDDDSLLAITRLRIVEVEAPSQCAPHMPDAPVEPGEPVPANPDPLAGFDVLYEGAALDASFDDRELVAPQDLQGSTGADAWRRDSLTHYLCLELSLPGLRYENTASVTAFVPGTGGIEPFPVTDTDTWASDVEPTQEQRAAEVTLRLPYATYRDGGETDRDLLAVEIVHTTPQDEYVEGDRLTFVHRVTNLTDVVRSTQLVESNLDHVEGAAACQWTTHAPSTRGECSSQAHIVTAEDLTRGHVTPLVSWVIYGDEGYRGGITTSVSVTGEPVTLSTR